VEASVRIKKRRDAIAAADVPRVFDDTCIARLALISKLPGSADMARFAAGIRESASVYARDVRAPAVGDVRDEIVALYNAARRRQYDHAASQLANLSPQARSYLTARLKLPGPRAAKIMLPSAKAMSNAAGCNEACEMIERVCRIGGAILTAACVRLANDLKHGNRYCMCPCRRSMCLSAVPSAPSS
jgi:hypothetical protein